MKILPSSREGPSTSPWTYTLLSHYICSLDKKFNVSRLLTPFKTLCSKENPQHHLISTMHSLLFADPPPFWTSLHSMGPLSFIFARRLGTNTVYLNIHKGSIIVSTHKNGYKIQVWWYRTPTLIHKFCPDIPGTCWRCRSDRGTLLHTWWACPNIQTYWTKVHRIITKVTTYELDYT